MAKFVLAGLLLLLYLYGGSYALTTAAGVILWGLAVVGVIGWLVWSALRYAPLLRTRPNLPISQSPNLLLPAFYLLAISFLSAIRAEPDLESMARMLILWLAVALLLLVDDLPLDASLWLAGWLWPLVWWFWPENPNIGSVWPLLFVLFGVFGDGGVADLVGRYYQKRGGLGGWEMGRLVFVAVHLGVLLTLGSRGALLGLAAGVVVGLWPVARPPWRVGALASVMGLVPLLYTLRPVTAGYRWHYWAAALDAWRSAPLLGIGPGQLWAGQWIPQPGTDLYQVHAHNALLTTLAETGIIGLAVLIWFVVAVGRHLSAVGGRWSAVTLIALSVWSLVDEPLWWPGPLILSVLIIRSQK